MCIMGLCLVIFYKKGNCMALCKEPRNCLYIYNNVYLLQHYPTCEPGLTFPSTDVTLRVPSKFTADRIIP